MNVELLCLGWVVILGLVHIILASHVRTKELGLKWNMSARDEAHPQLSLLAGRLARAQTNFFETFPLFAVAVLLASATQSFNQYTFWGTIVYAIARVVYLPLYAFGIPKLRSMVWVISIAGLLAVLLSSFTK